MNTFIPSPGFDSNRLRGTTLILPSVSIGNVPQLATDLLLTTLQLDRVGCIEDENVISVLGPADQPHDVVSNTSSASLSLAVEVFQTKDGKWTVVQQRSPTVRHRSHHYADNLLAFIKESGFEQVVILASADGARRIDIQLRSGTPIRYISSPAVSNTLIDTVKGLGLEPLENTPKTEDERQYGATASQLAEKVQDMELDTELEPELEKIPKIPNGGIARRLHSLCQTGGVAVLTIVKFAMEGDNAPDAIYLANVLNAVFKVFIPTEQQTLSGEGWKVPKSWDSLYGNTYHQDMYQ